MTQVQTLGKTEVWIHGVTLHEADLVQIARVSAAVLGLPGDRVFVTDVRERHVVLDVLVPSADLEALAGRQAALLEALSRVTGVTIAPDASVHSDGVLGVIGAPPEQAGAIVAETRLIDEGLRRYVARRMAIVSTGAEIVDSRILDTNYEVLHAAFAERGYEASSGGRVEDDLRSIAGRVARLAEDGYGLIVTTGGVGAEDKDFTVEALAVLDPALATATLATYTPGTGRHVKASVRIAVATVGWSRVVALPGPTHEVRLALPPLLDGLMRGIGAAELVESIAVPLRASLPSHHRHAR